MVVIAAEIRGNGIGRIRLKRIADGSSDSLTTFVREAVEKGGVIVSEGCSPVARFPSTAIATRDASWRAAPRPRLFFRGFIVSRPF